LRFLKDGCFQAGSLDTRYRVSHQANLWKRWAILGVKKGDMSYWMIAVPEGAPSKFGYKIVAMPKTSERDCLAVKKLRGMIREYNGCYKYNNGVNDFVKNNTLECICELLEIDPGTVFPEMMSVRQSKRMAIFENQINGNLVLSGVRFVTPSSRKKVDFDGVMFLHNGMAYAGAEDIMRKYCPLEQWARGPSNKSYGKLSEGQIGGYDSAAKYAERIPTF